jgi:alpha-mannosidase
MENEFVRVEMDQASGAIKHLVDKATGYDYVPEGELLGLMELHHEAPCGMSAWEIGQVNRITEYTQDGQFHVTQHGPQRASVRTDRKVADSRVSVEVGLNAGSREVDFTVQVHWVEIGDGQVGVPMLKIAFPVNIADPKVTYEIPFGSIERPVDGHEVPALKWADLSGTKVGANGTAGITMVNADKYGHNAEDNVLRLTLLRSSYEPDPIPETGDHTIRLAIVPHEGVVSISDATRAGAAFGTQMNVASTDIHTGKLPASKSFCEVLTPNVMLASVKKAEDSDAIIVRLFEMEGKDTEAKVRINDLVKPGTPAKQVDLMEQPLPKAKAKMESNVLSVKIPAHGIVSVMVG